MTNRPPADAHEVVPKTDVLIIGGGLAGLALADHLQAPGRDWLLVEAQDTCGGRIQSPVIAGGGIL